MKLKKKKKIVELEFVELEFHSRYSSSFQGTRDPVARVPWMELEIPFFFYFFYFFFIF